MCDAKIYSLIGMQFSESVVGHGNDQKVTNHLGKQLCHLFLCVSTPADPVGQVGVKLQHTSAASVSAGRCLVAECIMRAE